MTTKAASSMPTFPKLSDRAFFPPRPGDFMREKRGPDGSNSGEFYVDRSLFSPFQREQITSAHRLDVGRRAFAVSVPDADGAIANRSTKLAAKATEAPPAKKKKKVVDKKKKEPKKPIEEEEDAPDSEDQDDDDDDADDVDPDDDGEAATAEASEALKRRFHEIAKEPGANIVDMVHRLNKTTPKEPATRVSAKSKRLGRELARLDLDENVMLSSLEQEMTIEQIIAATKGKP